MLGYTKNNNEFYKGEYVAHYIKSAVSRSGGNFYHYQLFNNLLTHSIYNSTLKLNHFDCRAGYSLLFLYPVKTRIFLSLIFYKAELSSLKEYPLYELTNNIVNPVSNLKLINYIDNVKISNKVYIHLNNINPNFELYKPLLRETQELLLIKEDFDFRDKPIEKQLEQTFLLFNNTNVELNKLFIDVVSSNNRKQAASLICNYLNYKPISINILNKAIEKWINQSSNI